MSENEFYELQGDSYRGSRYANFSGGGITPQGNVSSAVTENSANSVGTSGEIPKSDAPPTPLTPSQGLTDFEAPRTSDLVIGGALPYAGAKVGEVAGAAIQTGASFGEGLGQGASSLASKASGGLIGTASNPTNIALSNLNGSYGPATQSAVNAASKASNVGSFGSGANLGAAAGAGFATAVATLLTGGSVKDAAKSGVATAVGTAIGSAILPGIGGPIGGFIGGLFCFAAKTPILMADGTRKNVEELRLGDEILHGGTVLGRGEGIVEALYHYKNTFLSPNHAVFEDGKWIRAKDSELAELVPQEEGDERPIVYPVITEENILATPWFISADAFEVPEENSGMTDEEIIVALNSYTARNTALIEAEKGLPQA